MADLVVPGRGLSPRVRGNHGHSGQVYVTRRSIPASAGEPLNRIVGHVLPWVYPRECGGTCQHHDVGDAPVGLSPRVRGNRMVGLFLLQPDRSIPASAGEPVFYNPAGDEPEVYPRECGGNLPAPWMTDRVHRSIPASAGEPSHATAPRQLPPVYPRECGGTIAWDLIFNDGAGLSPRVRGNRF